MMASMATDGMTCSKLEEEFEQFVLERMNSSYSPSPFDAPSYLEKYKVTDKGDGEVLKMIQFSQEMTSGVPQNRPSSLEVLKKMKEINPGIDDKKVCIYNYLEEVKVNQLWYATIKPADLRPIRTSRLNHLTHLTLKNILVTKQQLVDTIEECFVLKHLSLSIQISDFQDDELLPMPSNIPLPHLQTFRFRLQFGINENNKELHTDPDVEYGVPRIKSLMLFGPTSQIWENEMRVKVSYAQGVLVNIHAGKESFFFMNLHTGGLDEFLQILNHVQFQEVSLRELYFIGDEELQNLSQLWSPQSKKCVCELNLNLSRLNLTEGRFFQGFSCLRELSVSSRWDFGHSHNKIQLAILPSTITKLFLKEVNVSVDGMSTPMSPMKLEILDLLDCKVSSEFYQTYHEMFEIESLRIVKYSTGYKTRIVPGLSFVESIFNTSHWKTVILDPFNWKQTPENSEFREEFILSYFPKENEKSLEGKGIFLELIDGKEVAELTKRSDEPYSAVNVLNKRWRDWNKLDPTDGVDSDDEEGRLLVQRGLADPLDAVDERQQLSERVMEELDNNLEENFAFKGTLEYPTYRETVLVLGEFTGITRNKSKLKLKHIHLRDCSLRSNLPLQLKGCVNLESLVMSNVGVLSLVSHLVKITCRLPALKFYSVNMHSYLLPLGSNDTIHSGRFTFDSFQKLFFFRPGPQNINGLWGSGMETRVSVQNVLYFQLDKHTLTLQFLPEVNRILSLLELNETLETLNIQCCFLKLPTDSLPFSVKKLTLRYVDTTLGNVCECVSQLKSLETLIFEGTGDEMCVDVECIEALPTLKHLTLCNVTLCPLRNKMKVSLESFTLSRVKLDQQQDLTQRIIGARSSFFCSESQALYVEKVNRSFDYETLDSLLNQQPDTTLGFNQTFHRFLACEVLVLASGDTTKHSFNYETLYSLLTSPGVCMKSVTFINYERSIAPDASQDDLSKQSFCESFLCNHGIISNNFRLEMQRNSSRKWAAVEITPDNTKDGLLEGYLETRPYFEQNDVERRTENLKRHRDTYFLKGGPIL